MSRLHTYVVARDLGFAPNPFFGVCTLATCKPAIRRVADVGDWVAGTGSATKQRDGRLVYAMKVCEILSFDEYWRDPRFRNKRPYFGGSVKKAFGDNIYHQVGNDASWMQENSHHSLPDGTMNVHNLRRDTSADRVLIGREFVYFGGDGPSIPETLGENVVHAGIGHRNRFSEETVNRFVAWIRNLGETGYHGVPTDWSFVPWN